MDVVLHGYKTVLLKTGKWSYCALLDLGFKNYKNMSVFEAVHVLPDLGNGVILYWFMGYMCIEFMFCIETLSSFPIWNLMEGVLPL